jgi:hypothetical protein
MMMMLGRHGIKNVIKNKINKKRQSRAYSESFNKLSVSFSKHFTVVVVGNKK